MGWGGGWDRGGGGGGRGRSGAVGQLESSGYGRVSWVALGLTTASWQQCQRAVGELVTGPGLLVEGGARLLPTSGPPPATAAGPGEPGLCSRLARFLARPAARGGMSAKSSANAPTWTGRAAGRRRCRQSDCRAALLEWPGLPQLLATDPASGGRAPLRPNPP